MCRLALMNKQFIQDVGVEYLTAFYASLDATMGGNGMGVCITYDKKHQATTKKGVTTTAKQLAIYTKKQAQLEYMQYATFHCRMASIGYVCDENCQPFVSDNKKIVLAHNGHNNNFSGSIYDFSDSYICLMLLEYGGLPLKSLLNWQGVYVGTKNGNPYIAKASNYSDLELAYSYQTGGYCFASQFKFPQQKHYKQLLMLPDSYYTQEVAECLWYGGNIEAFIKENIVLLDKETKRYKQYWSKDYTHTDWDSKGNTITEKFVDGKWVKE